MATQREFFSPRGRIFLFEAGLWEHPALETCLACGNCENACPNRVPLPELVFLKKLEDPSSSKIPISKGPLLTWLPKEGTLLDKLCTDQLPKRASRTFSQNLKLPEKGDVTIFLSCGAEYLYPKATHKLILFLKGMGYSPGVTRPLCCGLPAASIGRKKVFLEQSRNTLEVLSQTEGPILTLCASCLWMFKKVYPLVFSDTKEEKKVHSVAQRVEEALSHLSPKVSTWPFQVDDLAIHIPCHLKEFKPQISFQGSQINLCCGSVTPKRLLFENQLPKPFLEKLMELGPSLLVTACTGCYLKLRKLLKVPPEVKHWAELLSV
ncbi:L-lactate dehydrogenase, Iron-sulfur cluster-binding subunit YkgF [Thermosulfurimonas dismutans]|uniref:L-lactate dehydrogenase, Iron-sulfur cluster-binding subunit YkgF n=1 Tax=Thermosulfurimonas dismutans TaxID=999894 RepID=A0A179D3W7_9BACT|nr:L-lactate dehydrogenase, Iron-sulfur cluster-binding subunit YkgF [Thermosulfurimonas dismutans]